MAGIKNFVLGFIFSFTGVFVFGQLYHPAYLEHKQIHTNGIHIDLFKKSDTKFYSLSKNNIFANIKKESLALNNTIQPFSPDGIEDDEILSIALDDDIPIEFSTPVDNVQNIEVSTEETNDTTAMLPSELLEDETDDTSSPWVIAKGGPNIKNKRLLEQINKDNPDKLFTETVASTDDDNLSYKVAEKIKQSIIFPIPDEILNDENLTPTFIHTPKNSAQKKQTDTTTKKVSVSTPKPVLKVEPKTKVKENKPPVENKNILDNISAWFTDNNKRDSVLAAETKPKTVVRQKKAPSYSSPVQNESSQFSQTEDLAQFYESLQQTRNEHIKRNIASLELKLSFQPGRAEISGRTLDWLKAFSEAAIKHNAYLQVRLDGSVDIELQKKRLNLLYTIFMNNGVDFKKIDTVFSLSEPNAFIIRTVKSK